MNINVPQSWRKLKDSEYQTYAVLNNELMHCEGAYLKQNDGVNQVITFYNYGTAEIDSLEKIKYNFLKNEEENELVDGSPADESFEDTSLSSLLWWQELELDDKEAFAHISRVASGENSYTYVFQLYFILGTNIYSVQSKLNDFDPSMSIEEYVDSNAVILEILNTIN